MSNSQESVHKVNFAPPRGFAATFKSHAKETLFPDDPFKQFKNEKRPIKKAVQYFVPIFEWLPKYNLKLFRYDLLAGITITSLAIPQGISYAKLGDIPPVVGLYSSFVPPLIYAIFGSSKHIAIGTVAAPSLLLAATIREKVSPDAEPKLYLSLFFTATLIAGIFQSVLGFLRLGIVMDFLSHSTIVGFMSGTAILICLQQLKGFFGLTKFTTKTDVISVLHAVFKYREEWRWESAVVGLIFLAFLLFTRYLKKRNPKLFWVSAIAPMVTVVVGGLFAYLARGENHGIPIVGHLNRGINPLSIKDLNFESQYLPVTLKAGILTGILAMAEGIAIGRSFAILKNYQTDGNKEMIAFGMMNIAGSLTSCYLTTAPFSKSAVNFNAGCRTAMSNIVMAIIMMLTLLLLAPLFSYIPLVALSAIIMTAMFGLIDYEEAYRLFKVDKFDFCICMAAFFGVTFITMDVGLLMSVGLAILRALLYVARPATCKLGNMPDSSLYCDIGQYPVATGIPGILILKLGSPIYFANCSYLKERIMRWIGDEADITNANVNEVEHLLLDIGGVSTIDMTGIETLQELRRTLEINGIKMGIVNPRMAVMEKMILSEFVDKVGRESFYMSIDEAVEACRFWLQESNVSKNDFSVHPTVV
ncbi:probable sulfate transporter 3.5 [Eucalyptus grandis]|uniref:probable sulfate transporter 3.5 n=1 Tax=Eucalyptus grandis TaxID=71139 RepID=UPI00192EC45F|nr:probable sulfate transporter 3.5 [Eucalyptus grandis]